jgi:hypothetical protein
LKDYKGCIKDCFEAIKINPKCANSYFYLGKCNQLEGFKTLACEKWSKAGELGKAEAYDLIQKYCH